MKILFQTLSFFAFILIGIYFFIVGRGIMNPPELIMEQSQSVATPAAEEKEITETEGMKLFNVNCTACHKINGNLVGPALAGVNQKYAGDEEWLVSWVRNAPGLIAKGDPKAVALYEQYNKQQMQSFANLSEDQVRQILAYIEEAS